MRVARGFLCASTERFEVDGGWIPAFAGMTVDGLFAVGDGDAGMTVGARDDFRYNGGC